jgi:hypothetical protein
VVDEESYFLELVRYLHLNPLRAGVVPNMRALADYPYCGHGSLLGKCDIPWQDTNAVLRRFARQVSRARALYRAFVADGVPLGRRPELMGGGLIRSAGGWSAVTILRRGREGYASDERVLGGSEFVESVREEIERAEVSRLRGRYRIITATDLIARVAAAERISLERLLGSGRARTLSRVRQGIAYLWIEELGRSGRTLARDLHLRPESIYYAARQGRQNAVHWRDVLGV